MAEAIESSQKLAASSEVGAWVRNEAKRRLERNSGAIKAMAKAMAGYEPGKSQPGLLRKNLRAKDLADGDEDTRDETESEARAAASAKSSRGAKKKSGRSANRDGAAAKELGDGGTPMTSVEPADNPPTPLQGWPRSRVVLAVVALAAVLAVGGWELSHPRAPVSGTPAAGTTSVMATTDAPPPAGTSQAGASSAPSSAAPATTSGGTDTDPPLTDTTASEAAVDGGRAAVHSTPKGKKSRYLPKDL